MDHWKHLIDTVRRLETDLRSALTLESVAKSAGCSKYYFSRLFKQHTGMPLMEYVRRRRLIHAAHELCSETTVLEIGSSYGYQTSGGFARAFKSEFGRSPSVYRRTIGRCRIEGHSWRSVDVVGDEHVLRLVFDFSNWVLNLTARSQTGVYEWTYWHQKWRRHPDYFVDCARLGQEVRRSVRGLCTTNRLPDVSVATSPTERPGH